MVTSIAVWYLIVQANAHVAPAQLGPYADLDSCNRVADMRRADGNTMINEPRGCVQVSILVQTLPVKITE